MTMTDGDWGINQWDVDCHAESLNKALFGKRRKPGIGSVKPDSNIAGKTGTDLGQDSGDDDDGKEKLSKKAKKKLKERRRKENVRNKKKAPDGENEENKNDGGENKKGKIKSKSPSKTEADKGKGKSKNTKLELKTKGSKVLNEKRKSSENDKEKEAVKKKKRKVSLDQDQTDNGGGGSPVKAMKTTEDNSNSQEGSESKKKKNRKKKKKPSSKKNKYKHLGLKADRPPASDSDSDNEMGQGAKKSKNILAPKGKDPVIPESSKKRKRTLSLSPDKMQAKKMKLVEESEKSGVKSKKQKKTLDVSHADDIDMELGDGKDVPGVKAKKLKKKNKSKSTSKEGMKEINKSDTIENVDMENISKKPKKEKGKKSKDALTADVNTKHEGKGEQKSTISPFFSSQGMDLQQKCMDKLVSGRFRFINEQLYTIKGGEAFRMFQQDKTLMDAYNTGFQSQVKQWSVNPLDVIIKQLSSKPSSLKVVDFGCGEARLSASVPQKVQSFDLYALNERVTVCNMAKTPLDSESMDTAVFCLSLMGTNLNDYLLEANRVLKEGGILKVAEVVSRITDLSHFTSAVSSMGFRCLNTRDLSKMFYLMDFKKVRKVKKSSQQIKALSLKPCVYKKR